MWRDPWKTWHKEGFRSTAGQVPEGSIKFTSCCTVLYCLALPCIATVLHRILLSHSGLLSSLLFRSTALHHCSTATLLHCNSLQRNSTLQHCNSREASFSTVLQLRTAQCTAELQNCSELHNFDQHPSELQCSQYWAVIERRSAPKSPTNWLVGVNGENV